MSLFENDVRCHVTDDLRLIPCIQTSLASPHVGVRYAACHCVRALSRAVAVLRTNIVDSGVGLDVYKIFQRRDEDRRVTFAASAVVCNLVAECSPLRPVRLGYFCSSLHDAENAHPILGPFRTRSGSEAC